jgi:1,4-alpha-glucan branching enzyme
MTPVERYNWTMRVSGKSTWEIVFNSDEEKYYGTGQSRNHSLNVTLIDKKKKEYEINLYLPALGALVLK